MRVVSGRVALALLLCLVLFSMGRAQEHSGHMAGNATSSAMDTMTEHGMVEHGNAPSAMAEGEQKIMEMTDHAAHAVKNMAMENMTMEKAGVDAMADEAMEHDMSHAMNATTEAGKNMQPMTATEHADDSGHGEHEAMDHSGMDGDMVDHSPEAHARAAEEAKDVVGITEHLDTMIADAMFTDADNNTVSLRELVQDVPTIILPIYYRCPNVCHILQGSFASVLPQVNLEPGREIQVISLSFDPRESVSDAQLGRRTIKAQLSDAYPIEHWKFLVGNQSQITAALDSLGFGVQKNGGIYAHPVGAIVVAPGGKIVRYLYGTGFLPFDVTMAMTEAAQGKTGLSIKRVLSFCYNYDPQGRKYVFDIMRVSGVVIVGSLTILLAVLLFMGPRKSRRVKQRERSDEKQ